MNKMNKKGKIIGLALAAIMVVSLFTAAVSAQAQPDLVITNMWTVDGKMHYTIANIGGADAPRSFTGVYEGGRYVTRGIAGALAPGASRDEEINYRGGDTVCADYQNRIAESNEGNNCNPPGPGPTPTPTPTPTPIPTPPDLVVEKTVEFVDGEFVVHYKVTNIGGGKAGASKICKIVNGVCAEIESVPALGPNGGFCCGDFKLEPCPPGATLNITVCADCTHLVDESDETNNCEINIVTCPEVDMPDLVVSEKWEESVDGQVIVHFIIENIGGAEAGASYATLYINSVLVEEQNIPVPALGPNGRFTDEFAAEDCPPGTTIIVTVCADDTNVVDESDETNNCMTNYFTCPGKPDLVVSDAWDEHVYICCGLWEVTKHFVVKNIGDTEAGPSIAGKKIDGVLMDTDDVPALAAGKSYASAFEPEPCPPGTTINFTVCADNFDDVDESNETNNCRINNCTCTTEKPDLVVIEKWEEAVKSDGHVIVHFIIENIGDADAAESEAALYIDRVRVQEQNVPVSALGPSGTFSGEFAAELCPLADNITVTVCADGTHVVDESNETNNCMTNNFICPSQGPDLVIDKTVEQEIVDCNTCEYSVSYTVTNIGNEVACGECVGGQNEVALLVDGVLLERQDCRQLGPGASVDGDFGWRNCPCANDFNVTVYADYYNVVDEGNESNNRAINPLHCGLEGIEVRKTVWDGVAWVEEIDAVRGDIVEFRGEVENTGCCCYLDSLMVTDVLPASLDYVDATPTPSTITYNVGGTTTIEWPESALGMCDTNEYRINATVIVDCGLNEENTMTAIANATCTGTVVTDSDSAWVDIPTTAGVSVDKTVWDGADWVDAITVNDDDIVEFKCVVRNTGVCQDLTFLTVWDTLEWWMIIGTGLDYIDSYGPQPPYGPQPAVVIPGVGVTKVEWDLPWNVVTLSPGEELVFLVNATARTWWGNTYTNTQEVTAVSIDQLTGASVWVYDIDTVQVTVTP